jgi:hypothetical protein
MNNDSYSFKNNFICDSEDNSTLNINYDTFNPNLKVSEDSIDEEKTLFIRTLFINRDVKKLSKDKNKNKQFNINFTMNKDNKKNSFQKKNCLDTAITLEKTKTDINIYQLNKEKNKSKIEKESEKNILSKETKQSIKLEKNITSIDNVNTNNLNNKFEKEYLGKKKVNKVKNNNNNLKKVRNMLLNSLFRFINKKIKKEFNNDIGKGPNIKQFKSVSKKNLSHSKVEFDKQFLNVKLKEIFSENVSKKYTNYLPNKNKDLFLNLKDYDYFKKIFELTFLDCIQHINGNKNILLDDFETIEEIILQENNKFDKEDIDMYKDIIINYQTYIENKKERKKKIQSSNF